MDGNESGETAEIRIDISCLKIRDLATLDQMARGTLSPSEIIDLLDRVVVGGAADLPLTAIGEIINALVAAVGEASNPADAEGKK